MGDNNVPVNIVILGNKGHGKSSFGNLILNKKTFPVSDDVLAPSRTLGYGDGIRGSFAMKVVEMPACHDDPYGQLNAYRLMILRANEIFDDSLHLFLLVIKFDVNTGECLQIFDKWREIMGSDIFERRGIIVITFGDEFTRLNEDNRMPDKTFSEWCCEQVGSLQTLLKECHQRRILVDNNAHTDQTFEELSNYMQQLYTDNKLKATPRGLDLLIRLRTHRETMGARIVPVNIVILGNEGHGKSSLANFILNKKTFPVSGDGLAPSRTLCYGTGNRGNFAMKVVEMPACPDGPNDQLQAYRQMIFKANEICRYGFHLFLLVIKFESANTGNCLQIFDKWREILGWGNFWRRAVVVITFGDEFRRLMENGTPDKTFREWCCEQGGNLQRLFRECKQRRILFDNNAHTEYTFEELSYFMREYQDQPLKMACNVL